MATDPTKINVILLAVCQALGMSGASIMMTSAAVVGATIAPDRALATLPLALSFLGMMATTIPASQFMQFAGRRPGFIVGGAIGATGACIAAWGIWTANFPVFCLGCFCAGSATAFVHFYRFAAADTASESFRPMAISLVMAGGVASALLGPNLANWAKDLFVPAVFAGSFLAFAGLHLLAICILCFLRIPRPTAAERADSGRPLWQIARQPAFIAAVLAAMFGYGVMTFIMTATPLAVLDCDYAFADVAFIIQWHVLGMYLPSFFTGRLIQRFGAPRVMLAGCLCYLGTVAFNVSGIDLLVNFWVALVLLGVGWNFVFVGATSLVTRTYRPAERAKAQGLNDFLVFSTVALASLSSGVLYEWFDWSTVNLGILPLIAIICAAVVYHLLQQRRPAAA